MVRWNSPSDDEAVDRGLQTPDLVRMDTHCHSSASSAPVIPLLGPLGVPESYSPPERVYEQAMARGMDLVTITDHDTIDGVMRLVDRGYRGVVIGEEVTVLFPEDGCKLHVLVWCLTPEQHEEIGSLGLRRDVYAFAAWLRDQNLPHALAHPLYVQNHRMSRWHLDRCSLLFKGFETLNGAHSGMHRSGIEAYLGALTPGRVLELIEETGIEPLWPRIWEKARTGGSDDHALLNTGRTWTGVPLSAFGDEDGDWPRSRVVDTPREFFRKVMQGRTAVGGVAGHSVLLAHQISAVGARFLADTLFSAQGTALSTLLGHRRPTARAQLVASKLLSFAGIPVKPPSKVRLALGEVGRVVRLRGRPRPNPLLASLRQTLGPTLRRYPDVAERLARVGTPEHARDGAALAQHDRVADFVCEVYAAAARALADAGAARARSRDVGGVLAHAKAALTLELTQLPYLFSLFHQNKERPFVDSIEREAILSQARSSGQAEPREPRPMRLALFTDTLGDVNGVSRFINDITDQSREAGRDLHVFTSTRFPVRDLPTIHNFEPVLAGKVPGYENLEWAIPPVVRMLRAIDAHQPDVIHISTPGPVGLVGFIAARMLKVPVVGVYHTDFPRYVDELFENDPTFSRLARLAMSQFYRPFRAIFTRSREYVDSLCELGIERSRCAALKPGLQTSLFRPDLRDDRCWDSYGVRRESVKALFVGRVSVEKNMPMLARIWREAHARLRREGRDAELIIVGDGPFRAEMEAQLAGTDARFLGFRYGEELSRIYASSDLFVFPSVTDTLGQVVMESQCSGLPVLVSDVGGPKEIVRDGQTGYVLGSTDLAAWVDSVVTLVREPQRRQAMGRAAREFMSGFSIRDSFEHFWEVHVDAWRATFRPSDDSGAPPPARASVATAGPARAASAESAARIHRTGR